MSCVFPGFQLIKSSKILFFFPHAEGKIYSYYGVGKKNSLSFTANETQEVANPHFPRLFACSLCRAFLLPPPVPFITKSQVKMLSIL